MVKRCHGCACVFHRQFPKNYKSILFQKRIITRSTSWWVVQMLCLCFPSSIHIRKVINQYFHEKEKKALSTRWWVMQLCLWFSSTIHIRKAIHPYLYQKQKKMLSTRWWVVQLLCLCFSSSIHIRKAIARYIYQKRSNALRRYSYLLHVEAWRSKLNSLNSSQLLKDILNLIKDRSQLTYILRRK